MLNTLHPRNRKGLASKLLFISLLFTVFVGYAVINPPGEPDLDFGINGILPAPVPAALIGNSNNATNITSDNVGRTLVSAYNLTDSFSTYNTITRYLSDGSLDQTFGRQGVVTYQTDFFAVTTKIKLDHKDRIILLLNESAVFGSAQVTLMRFTDNGTPDPDFGGRGKIFVPVLFHNNTVPLDIQIDNNNQLLLATRNDPFFGDSEPPSVVHALTLITESGERDQTFGDGDGIARIPTTINAYDWDNQGNIVIAGQLNHLSETEQLLSSDFTLMRLNAKGLVDTSFGHQGTVLVDTNGFDGADAMAVNSDDKIVVQGRIENQSTLLRFDATGTLDTDFGDNGKVGSIGGNHLVIEQNNAIYLAGLTVRQSGNQNIGFSYQQSQFKADGAIDDTFGNNGTLISDYDIDDYDPFYFITDAHQLRVTASIVNAANESKDIYSGHFDSLGQPDLIFGDKGFVLTDHTPTQPMNGTIITIDQHNNIVAGGNRGDFTMLKFNSAGQWQQDFADNGVAIARSNSPNLLTHILPQSDGSYLASSNGIGGFFMVRYDSQGQLDQQFADDGILYNPLQKVQPPFYDDNHHLIFIGAYEEIDTRQFRLGYTEYTYKGKVLGDLGNYGSIKFTDINFRPNSMQRNGDKILLAGKLVNDETNEQTNAVVRLNLNGTTDTTFNDGSAVLSAPFSHWHQGAMHLTTDINGNIIVVGLRLLEDSNNTAYVATRLFSDGSIDRSFGDNGEARPDLPLASWWEQQSRLDVDINGNLLLTDIRNVQQKIVHTVISRINANGALDSQFGSNGSLSLPLANENQLSAFLPSLASATDDSYLLVCGQKLSNDIPLLWADNRATIRFNQGDSAVIHSEDLWLTADDVANLNEITLTTVPSSGEMYLDLNQNGSRDEDEDVLTAQSTVGMTPLSANQLRYHQTEGTLSTTFSFTKGLATDNSEPMMARFIINPKPVVTRSELNDGYDTIELYFSEAVYGLEQDEISVNGPIASLTGSGNHYTIGLQAPLTTNAHVSVAAGALTDYHGNANQPITQPFANLPWVTMTTSTLSASNGPVTFALQYSGIDSVNLQLGDITLNASTGVSGTLSLADTDTLSPMITVSDITGNGSFFITLPEGTGSFNQTRLTPAIESELVTVLNNSAPSIAGRPMTDIDEDVSYHFSVLAWDADDDNLTYHISSYPSWASFNPSTAG
ncbi:MAG: putative delta-60 repeat protein [Phenylobacterium sp.]|jgi:uncharacterized delta-60 repeat protein